jgi:hypothetical protein
VVVESLGVASGRPQQARHGIFGDVDEAGGGAHPASFAEMVDDGRRLFLRNLRIEQGRATSLGELLTARSAASESNMVLTVDLAYGQIVLARETKPMAFRVDTRESSEAGSLHEVLLEYSWLLSQGLHTTRRLLSTCVMITGHYPMLRQVYISNHSISRNL